MAIELTPVPAPLRTHTPVTKEQVLSLISVISSADPAVINLPSGKNYTDVVRFNLTVLPNGNGVLDVLLN